MNLEKLSYNEVKDLEAKIGNIEKFKMKFKTGNAGGLDIFKDKDSSDKDIYVANKDGSAPEETGETLY